MIRIEFKDGKSNYVFELKNREREMDLCIDIAQCDSRAPARTFKITNTFGIVRFIKSDNVKLCQYIKSPLHERAKESVGA